MRIIYFLFLIVSTSLFAAPKHKRDGSNLPHSEQQFAGQLSIRQRKIFCGQFNHDQRKTAISYAKGRNQDQCCTPDEAVRRVMEESGMSLAVKGRPED